MDSILTSIKKYCNLTESYEPFDEEVILYINALFAILNQCGIGPADGFSIEDATPTWSDYIENDQNTLAFVKLYIKQKAKLLFDPPASSTLLEAIKESIKEMEFRLGIRADIIAENEENQDE